MKALIIGGNRYFGKRLASLLLEAGHEVTLLNRGQVDDGLGARVKRIKLDRAQLCRDHPSLGADKWDIVFDQVCFDANEARGALDAFTVRASKYVFVSSQSVYGPPTPLMGANLEESDFDPTTYTYDTPKSREEDYAEAKRQAESVFLKQSKLPVCAVRFPIVCGPDDYTGRLKWHVDRIKAGLPIFFPNIKARLSLIHSADAARFLANLLAKWFVGPINVASLDSISLADLVGTIERKSGVNWCDAVSGSPDSASPFGIESDWYMDLSRLRRLGFSPRAIVEWLPEEV